MNKKRITGCKTSLIKLIGDTCKCIFMNGGMHYPSANATGLASHSPPFEPPKLSRQSSPGQLSWVDLFLQNSNAPRGKMVLPDLRVRRHNLPEEFEELYARFISMMLVLDPRIFLDVMDDCFRDTVDHMNSDHLKEQLSKCLGSRFSNDTRDHVRSSRTPAETSQPTGYDEGTSAPNRRYTYERSPRTPRRRRRRPKSAGPLRRPPETPVRFNESPNGYSTWMGDRTKLQKEKKKLLSQVNTLTDQAKSQNLAYSKIQMKVIRLERAMTEIQAKLGGEDVIIPRANEIDDNPMD